MSFRSMVFACCLLSLPGGSAEAAPLDEGDALVQKGPTVLPRLLQQLAEASDSHAKRVALYALGEFGPAAKAAIPNMARALGDEDRWVRLNALKALGKMGPFAAKETASILALTKDEDGSVHNEVAATVAAIGLAALPEIARELVREGDWRIYRALAAFGAGALPVLGKYCEQRGQLPFATRDATWALFEAAKPGQLPESCAKELSNEFTAHAPTRREIEYLARSIEDPATPEQRKHGYTPDYEALNRSFLLGAMGRGAHVLLPDLKEARGRITDAKLGRVLDAAIRRIEENREPGAEANDPHLVRVMAEVAAGQDETAEALLRTLDSLPRPVLLYLSGLVPTLEAMAEAEPERNLSLRTHLYRDFVTLGPTMLPRARRLLPVLLARTSSRDEKSWLLSQVGDFGAAAIPDLVPYLESPDPVLRLAAARGLEKLDDPAARASLKAFWAPQGLDPRADLGSLPAILKQPLAFDAGLRKDRSGLVAVVIGALLALLDAGFVVRNCLRRSWRRELAWLAGSAVVGVGLGAMLGGGWFFGVAAALVLATNARIVFAVIHRLRCRLP